MDNETNETKVTEERQRAQPKIGTTTNPLAKWFVGLGFGLFALAVLVFTASLSLEVMGIVLPNNPLAQWFSLCLYDFGAFIWGASYLFKAKGTPQRGISLLMTVLDLFGVVGMTSGAVLLGGQNLTDIPEGLGAFVVIVVIVSTLANVAALYYFHLNDPDSRVKIALQNFNDMVFDESLRQAEADVKANIRKHGAIMALGLMAQYKFDLGLPLTKAEKAALSEDVIDAQAVEIPALPAPAPRVLPAWWIGVLRYFGMYKPVNVVNPTEAPHGAPEGSTDGQTPE